jgi:glutaminyl-tRNA synthetase
MTSPARHADASKQGSTTAMTTESAEPKAAPSNFIRDIVVNDLASNKYQQRVFTRFPPEPNGYLHIGHAKSICLNFGLAQGFASNASGGARTHLRLDDTNPTKEDQEYIDAIKTDVRWLGFDWGSHEYYASDYFQTLHDWAVALIKAGHAYVCDLTGDQVRQMRGTLTAPGQPSPFRNRSVEENLDLFARMTKGEFPDASRTLRAKIDMASPNVNLRDPVMYRILHAHHPRTGEKWCVYPMYDWAHGQSDWLEGITHSICTLEFEDHRPLYAWFINTLKSVGIDPLAGKNLGDPPQQIEFARLNLSYTVMSKRKLLHLVTNKLVRGWDDPRLPTISGMRRRGYTPASLRAFCEGIGVAKRENTIELQRLEFHVREDLNKTSLRRMAVLKPLKLVITNYPAGQVEHFEAVNNPEDPAAGVRQVPFSRELYIEADDFMENPPKGYFRLSPGKEVRLRAAYWVKAESIVKDAAGNITEVHCTYDPATKGGNNPPDGRKVKATIHWVSAQHAANAEVRLYETLFTKEDPEAGVEGNDWLKNVNPNSEQIVANAKVEPALASAHPGERFQFERLGYFTVDTDSTPSKLVFNRTVTLKDSWAKEQAKS